MFEHNAQKEIDTLVSWMHAGQRGNGAASAINNNGHTKEDKSPVLTDQEVLKLLFAEEQRGREFEDVYNGNYEPYHPSPSEAIGSLLWRFAFYTGKNAEQMERLIRGSALPQEKFDTRRGGTTWLGREISRAVEDTDDTYTPPRSRRSRSLFSSFHSPLGGGSDDEHNEHPGEPALEIKWFSELGEPKPRKYIIETVGVKGYPVVAYGAGGVAKSFAMLAAGIAIAGGSKSWLGLRILEHGPVLYLDFELDIEEQHRRVRDLCNGLNAFVPKKLAYLSGVGIPAEAVFKRAYDFVEEHKAVAVVIDSVGLAMVGDMDRAKDVNAFYKRYIDPFRRIGVTPFLVDHEGKLQSGEKHKDKAPIGSVYKQNNSRSVLQFTLDEYDKENSALDIRVRQHKTNFVPLEPFGVRITFEEHKVSIETRELPAEETMDEDRLPVRERILAALRIEPQTIRDLEALTGAAVGTIYNNLSRLLEAGEVAEDGYKGRKKVYRLAGDDFVTTTNESNDKTRQKPSSSFSSSPAPPRENESDENKQAATSDDEQAQAPEAELQEQPLCKEHRERGCRACMSEVYKLVRQGMKPEMAQREVYLQEED